METLLGVDSLGSSGLANFALSLRRLLLYFLYVVREQQTESSLSWPRHDYLDTPCIEEEDGAAGERLAEKAL